MMIYEKLLRLNQMLSGDMTYMLIGYVSEGFVEKLEREKDKEKIFQDAISKIESSIERCCNNNKDYKAMMSLREAYAEAYMFSKIGAMVSIERVAEEAESRPDFKMTYRSKAVYAELKTIHPQLLVEKAKALSDIFNDENEKTKESIERGDKVVSSSWVSFSSLGKTKPAVVDDMFNDSQDLSVKEVIQGMIKKIDSAIKLDQFKFGDTLLLLDFGDETFIHYAADVSIEKSHADNWYEGARVSGELWHVACGKIGDQILGLPNSSGAVLDGELEIAGILVSYPYIKGIIFHIKGEFYSICRVNKADEVDSVPEDEKRQERLSCRTEDPYYGTPSDVNIACLLEYISKKSKTDIYNDSNAKSRPA